jgi:ATP-dependent RNA helicase DHX36
VQRGAVVQRRCGSINPWSSRRGISSTISKHSQPALQESIPDEAPPLPIALPPGPIIARNEVKEGSHDSEAEHENFKISYVPSGPEPQPEKTQDSETGVPRAPELPVPVEVPISSHVIGQMVKTIREARALGLPDQTAPVSPTLPPLPSNEGGNTSSVLGKPNDLLKYRLLRTKKKPEYIKLRKKRDRLPIMQPDTATAINHTLRHSDVLVLSADTGSGKSTQIPQLILDEAILARKGHDCRIICTQPRRISATALARRVAVERAEDLGLSVGFHVRFARVPPSKHASILYCTTGILLRRLQENSNSIMDTTSHLIIDEAHERDLATDHVLTFLRAHIHERRKEGKPYPKLIVMSATVDGKIFKQYFGDPLEYDSPLSVSYMEVPGRAFGVTNHYLGDILPKLEERALADDNFAALLDGRKDRCTPPYLRTESELDRPPPAATPEGEVVEDDLEDSDEAKLLEAPSDQSPLSPTGLVAASIAHVAATTSKGDILIFVPGISEIEKTIKLLEGKPLGLDFGGKLPMFKLHSSLADTNDQVFDPVPTHHRRVILATNIAETSITLPEIRYVIDTGTARSSEFDSLTGEHTLSGRWISRANLKQRRGRAGRTQAGEHYALFTEARWQQFDEHTVPEVVRADLSSTCLEIAGNRTHDIHEFMAKFPTPPSPERVQAALQNLRRIGATTEDNDLTTMGNILARIPLHPAASKTVLLGILFKCLEPMLVIGSTEEDTLLVDDLLRSTTSRNRRHFAGLSESDWVANFNAYKAYDEALKEGDLEQAEFLRSSRSIRPYQHRHISQVIRQVYSAYSLSGLVPKLSRANVREQIPSPLNKNADNFPLIKALLLASQTPNIAVAKGPGSRFTASAADPGRISLAAPTTVNHLRSGQAVKEIGRKRAAGDLIAHGRRRETLISRVSWIDNGSMVTPLVAVLFGNDVKQKDATTVTVDDLVEISFVNESHAFGLSDAQTTKLVLEFRKALDRFMEFAYEGLQMAVLTSTFLQKGYLEFSENEKLRNHFVSGVAKILKIEDDLLMAKFESQKSEAALLQQEEELDKEVDRG